MATTTPNYGWPVPTSTDYVKDGATAIEALGDAIDATVFGLGSSALTLIKTQTIGSAVSSVEVTGAFSATYDNYLIQIADGVASGAGTLRMTLGATVTGYYWSSFGTSWNSTLSANGGSNTTLWSSVGSHNASGNTMSCQVLSPFLSKLTFFNSTNGDVGTSYGQIGMGFLNNTTSYSAFTLTPATGTLTGGKIRVYGYKN